MFQLVDGGLIEALKNPYRSNALGMCSLRPTSAKDVSRELGISGPLAHHHLNRLLELGCIEPVHTEPGGSGGTTFYRATVRHYLEADDYAPLSPEDRMGVVLGILTMISNDISHSIRSKLIVKHDDDHMSRTPMRVDQEGWDQVTSVLNRASKELWEIRGKAEERLAASAESPRHIRVAIVHCEVPPPHDG